MLADGVAFRLAAAFAALRAFVSGLVVIVRAHGPLAGLCIWAALLVIVGATLALTGDVRRLATTA